MKEALNIASVGKKRVHIALLLFQLQECDISRRLDFRAMAPQVSQSYCDAGRDVIQGRR